MKVTIEHDEKIIKEFNIPFNKVLRGVTHASVLGAIGREINRVRPPRRNIGAIFNWMAAAAISDALMNMAFPKKEPEVVAEEKAEEVKPEGSEAKDGE
jgi:hypothetical protein